MRKNDPTSKSITLFCPIMTTSWYNYLFFLNQGPNVVHNEMGDVTVGSHLVTTSKNQLQTGLSQTDVGLMRVITIR